jgi:membrane-associated protein
MAVDTAFDLLRAHGPAALVLLMALNRLGLVPGGMLILVMVGTIPRGDPALLPPLLVAAYLGTMLGDTALYGAGRFGLGWLRRRQAGRRSHGRATALLARWGAPAVFLTRWLVLPLTIAVSLICGASRFPYRPFALTGAIGNLLFVLIFVGLGYRFGAGWREALAWAAGGLGGLLTSPGGLALLALGAAALLLTCARRRRAVAKLAVPPKPLG